jgi:hypothetical protein
VDVARPELRRQAVAFTIEQQQRVVACGLKMPVVSAILLLTINRDLGTVDIEHNPPG